MTFLGGVEGLVMYLLHAPLWAFYVAPVLMGPFLIWELLRLDAEYQRNEAAPFEGRRPHGNPRRAAGAPGP